jgi:hypothetical protein
MDVAGSYIKIGLSVKQHKVFEGRNIVGTIPELGENRFPFCDRRRLLDQFAESHKKSDNSARRHGAASVGAGRIPHKGSVKELGGNSKVLDELSHEEEVARVQKVEGTHFRNGSVIEVDF